MGTGDAGPSVTGKGLHPLANSPVDFGGLSPVAVSPRDASGPRGHFALGNAKLEWQLVRASGVSPSPKAVVIGTTLGLEDKPQMDGIAVDIFPSAATTTAGEHQVSPLTCARDSPRRHVYLPTTADPCSCWLPCPALLRRLHTITSSPCFVLVSSPHTRPIKQPSRLSTHRLPSAFLVGEGRRGSEPARSTNVSRPLGSLCRPLCLVLAAHPPPPPLRYRYRRLITPVRVRLPRRRFAPRTPLTEPAPFNLWSRYAITHCDPTGSIWLTA
ncbi:hypothetical protein V2G26_007975 [Clonostachys chloroleuca]